MNLKFHFSGGVYKGNRILIDMVHVVYKHNLYKYDFGVNIQTENVFSTFHQN